MLETSRALPLSWILLATGPVARSVASTDSTNTAATSGRTPGEEGFEQLVTECRQAIERIDRP